VSGGDGDGAMVVTPSGFTSIDEITASLEALTKKKERG
jgi:hypothetical protein